MKVSTKFGLNASLMSLLIVSQFMVGCGQDQEVQSHQKIYGGSKVAPGGWPSTIALVTRNSQAFCTATIIHPNIAITAAHCIQPWPPFGVFFAYQGAGVEGGFMQGQKVIIRYGFSPDFELENDIGYIYSGQAFDIAPENIPQVLTKSDEIDEIIQLGNEVTIVGYGQRERGSGVKYEATVPITGINELEVSLGGDGIDSCTGDSGGPAYGRLANGELRVFGVVSRGGRCGEGGIWGRMSANICWVQSDSGVDLNLPEGTCPES